MDGWMGGWSFFYPSCNGIWDPTGALWVNYRNVLQQNIEKWWFERTESPSVLCDVIWEVLNLREEETKDLGGWPSTWGNAPQPGHTHWCHLLQPFTSIYHMVFSSYLCDKMFCLSLPLLLFLFSACIEEFMKTFLSPFSMRLLFSFFPQKLVIFGSYCAREQWQFGCALLCNPTLTQFSPLIRLFADDDLMDYNCFFSGIHLILLHQT